MSKLVTIDVCTTNMTNSRRTNVEILPLFTSKYLKEETRTVPTSSLNINKGKLGLTTSVPITHTKVSKRSLKNKKVLLTFGPTWVPIDNVRVISNISTGKLGHLLVDLLKKEGTQLTVLQGPVVAQLKSQSIRVVEFRFYDELASLMKVELKRQYDIIIHAAAVSDYELTNPFKKKISSRLSRLKFDLKPTAKIIEKIKKASPNSLLVGFKLADNINTDSVRQEVGKLFQKAKCDLVVVNSLTKNKYRGHILDPKRNVLATAQRREELSRKLIHLLRERV